METKQIMVLTQIIIIQTQAKIIQKQTAIQIPKLQQTQTQ